jgi:spermidine synthase
VLKDARTRAIVADGRNYLTTTRERYDVIISEPSNLHVAGTVNLFTVEYFRLARAHLAPAGLFCLWMHYYGAGMDDCRTVVRTVAAVFPELTVWINRIGGDLFIIAGETPQTASWTRWRSILADPARGLDLYRIGITSPVEIANLFQFGPRDARAFAGPGPECTDDRPLLEFTTPLVADTWALVTANRDAFDAFPVTEPVPLTGASRNDRRGLARAARLTNRTGRAAIEERTAGRAR